MTVTQDQLESASVVRQVGRALSTAIAENTPEGVARDESHRLVNEAVELAEVAILRARTPG